LSKAVLGSFFAAGQIDAAHVFLAPKLIGGTAGKSPLGGPGLARLELARQLEIREVTRIGEDVYVHAETPFTHRPL
jgi:diaminohydroxyphosphoribosylaminopyrimidine deaminase/5-amino-6-(5-phosphoribosylamino)uracil reductase